MRSIWKGSISFGLVNIPVALYSAVRKEQVKLRLLRKKDLSPVNYKRVAEADGQEVPWEEIVKGYEFEKGQFVVIDDQDFEQLANLQPAQTIQIVDFVNIHAIDSVYFDKPYYLEPQKGGSHAYALLREVMEETETVGIAKVTIRTKQHLAAVKPKGRVLLLELMHFADEVLDPNQLITPEKAQPARNEMELAKALVSQMAGEWNPAKYKDEYRSVIMEVVEKKVQAGSKGSKDRKTRPAPANVVDMVQMLERSLSATRTRKGPAKAKKQKAAA